MDLRNPAGFRPGWSTGLALLLALSACRSAPRHPFPPPAPGSTLPLEARTPGWVGEPLSWQQLGAIETWLATHAPAADPFWRVEGELQLNLGRLELARRESAAQPDAGAPGKPGTPDTIVRSRVRTARAGLERVLADEGVNGTQKSRAQDGIARCDRLLGAAGPGPVAGVSVVPRAQWGAKPPAFEHMERNRSGWTRVTVHHSADRNPPPLDGTLPVSAAAVRGIQKAHMEGKETHYGDIGYHFVVDPYGRVFQGRDLGWQGAHAAGENNVQNIGVCLIGNFDVEKPTPPALLALQQLLDQLRSTWSIAMSSVITHHEIRRTDCPGRHLQAWVEGYRGGAARAAAAAPVAAAGPLRAAARAAAKGTGKIR